MKWLFPFLLFLVSACRSDKIAIPDDILKPDEMKVIFTDIHVADAVAEVKGQEGMDEKLLTLEYHAQVFKNHGTSRQEFLKSLKFYEANPKLMDEVYADVLNELTRREAEAGKGN